MIEETTSRRRYEWCITVEADGEELDSFFQGFESSTALGNLFAMWVKNRGALTDWPDARQFGETVVTYSDLAPRVVAVWLGLSPEAFATSPAPKGLSAPTSQALSWEFTDPEGRPMTLERTVTE